MSAASTRPPDTARLPHLQQLAHRADRRLLIGSAALAVAGLVLALRGPHALTASLVAAAVLPGIWLAGPKAGHCVTRNGLALLLSLQLAGLCAITGLSPALPIALLLGVLLSHRDRLPVWLAGGIGTLALLAPLQDGAALWPTLLQVSMFAG